MQLTLYCNVYSSKIKFILFSTQILPLSQIISHSKNLGESKHLKFEQIRHSRGCVGGRGLEEGVFRRRRRLPRDGVVVSDVVDDALACKTDGDQAPGDDVPGGWSSPARRRLTRQQRQWAERRGDGRSSCLRMGRGQVIAALLCPTCTFAAHNCGRT